MRAILRCALPFSASATLRLLGCTRAQSHGPLFDDTLGACSALPASIAYDRSLKSVHQDDSR